MITSNSLTPSFWHAAKLAYFMISDMPKNQASNGCGLWERWEILSKIMQDMCVLKKRLRNPALEGVKNIILSCIVEAISTTIYSYYCLAIIF
jgi:hypothetical protein